MQDGGEGAQYGSGSSVVPGGDKEGDVVLGHRTWDDGLFVKGKGRRVVAVAAQVLAVGGGSPSPPVVAAASAKRWAGAADFDAPRS